MRGAILREESSPAPLAAAAPSDPFQAPAPGDGDESVRAARPLPSATQRPSPAMMSRYLA